MHITTIIKTALVINLLAFTAGCGSDDSKDSRVVVGRGDTILTDNDLLYRLPMVVQVSDGSGVPQSGVLVNISLSALEYFKGSYAYDLDVDVDGDNDFWNVTANATCTAETDANVNGMLDPAEDTNGNGITDPSIPTIAQHPTETPTLTAGTASLITDANGAGFFVISYPRSEGNWVSVRVRASAEDGLPSNTGSDSFTLPVASEDLEDPLVSPPGGVNGPYGIAGVCTNPN